MKRKLLSLLLVVFLVTGTVLQGLASEISEGEGVENPIIAQTTLEIVETATEPEHAPETPGPDAETTPEVTPVPEATPTPETEDILEPEITPVAVPDIVFVFDEKMAKEKEPWLEATQGDQFKVEYQLSPEIEASSPRIDWTSSEEEIASVNNKGVVSALAAGKTLLRATLPNGQYAECPLIVAEKGDAGSEEEQEASQEELNLSTK